MASPPKKGGKDQGCEFQETGNYWRPFQKLSAPIILIQEVLEMPPGHTFLMSNSSDPDRFTLAPNCGNTQKDPARHLMPCSFDLTFRPSALNF